MDWFLYKGNTDIWWINQVPMVSEPSSITTGLLAQILLVSYFWKNNKIVENINSMRNSFCEILLNLPV